jgi:metal-responsive CopG/Arc/MetJ family transcriptional regulator
MVEMKRLAVDLDEDLHRGLKEAAAREGISVSEVVRQLITDWVRKKRPE